MYVTAILPDVVLTRLSLILPVPEVEGLLIPATTARDQEKLVPAMEEIGEKLNWVLLQIVAGLGVGLFNTGNGFTDTVIVCVFTQPLASVPTTV